LPARPVVVPLAYANDERWGSRPEAEAVGPEISRQQKEPLRPGADAGALRQTTRPTPVRACRRSRLSLPQAPRAPTHLATGARPSTCSPSCKRRSSSWPAKTPNYMRVPRLRKLRPAGLALPQCAYVLPRGPAGAGLRRTCANTLSPAVDLSARLGLALRSGRFGCLHLADGACIIFILFFLTGIYARPTPAYAAPRLTYRV